MAACVKRENDLAECDPCCCRSHITTMITTNAHEISLERGRLWIVLVTIVINIVAVSLLTSRLGQTGAPAQRSTLSIIVFSSALYSLGAMHCSRDFFFLDSWSASLSSRLTPGWSITRVRWTIRLAAVL